MPTYEYACTSCGRHLEAVQKFSDDPLTTCPHCGGPLRKVFGSIGIVLKGSGFYRNDSRSSSEGRSRSAKGRDTTGTDSSSTGADAKGSNDGASKGGGSTSHGSSDAHGSSASHGSSDAATTSKAGAANAS